MVWGTDIAKAALDVGYKEAAFTQPKKCRDDQSRHFSIQLEVLFD